MVITCASLGADVAPRESRVPELGIGVGRPDRPGESVAKLCIGARIAGRVDGDVVATAAQHFRELRGDELGALRAEAGGGYFVRRG